MDLISSKHMLKYVLYPYNKLPTTLQLYHSNIIHELTYICQHMSSDEAHQRMIRTVCEDAVTLYLVLQCEGKLFWPWWQILPVLHTF